MMVKRSFQHEVNFKNTDIKYVLSDLMHRLERFAVEDKNDDFIRRSLDYEILS